MDSVNYTHLYNLILDYINTFDCRDNGMVKDRLLENQVPYQFKISCGLSENQFFVEANRAVLGLVEDKMIRATARAVYSNYAIITINGLTSKGHTYLAAVKVPKTMNKIKKILHDEGFPITPQSISKVVTRLFID